MAALTEVFEQGLPRLAAALRGYERAESEGGVALTDPRDGAVVGSHYALSHCLGALMLCGGAGERERAKRMLQYVAATQERYLKYPDYHYDFNNLVWSLLLSLHRSGRLELEDDEVAILKKLLLESGDSHHMTLNWLPMRAWNNFERWKITGDAKYRKLAEKLLAMVRRAQEDDGLFGDRVQRGRSANPQYHAYTAAVLTLGNRLGVWDFPQEALDRAMQWLTGIVLPDGDFNYFGRGGDQIFGWGPWFYLLAVNGIAPGVSGDYFLRHLPEVLERKGLMLDSTDGETRFWRSYHHASVYQAHLYFWLTLASMVGGAVRSELKTLPGDRCGAYIFRGMRDMLPERGPLVAAFWTRKLGVCFKCPLGNVADNPSGAKENATLLGVLANYCGVVKVGRRSGFDYRCGAVFPKHIAAETTGDGVALRFRGLPRPGWFFDWRRHGIDIRRRYREYFYFQLPVFHRLNLDEAAVDRRFEIIVAGQKCHLHFGAAISGIYGDVDVYSTSPLPISAEEIVLRIRDVED